MLVAKQKTVRVCTRHMYVARYDPTILDLTGRKYEGNVKKNLNASRPSEHPRVRGGKCQNV